MTPVLTAENGHAIDAATIERQGITSLELMERAATACATGMRQALGQLANEDKVPLLILCGPGNNGGDGLVLARLFTEEGRNVRVLEYGMGSRSPDNATNYQRALAAGVATQQLDLSAPNPYIPDNVLLIDALFGTGLSRPLTGKLAERIAEWNERSLTVWSVDLPSGLFANRTVEGPVLRANRTFSLGYPKLAEMVPENAAYLGEVVNLTFSLCLPPEIEAMLTDFQFTIHDARRIRKHRGVQDHKGIFGHALLVAGAHGTMGAALLSARAALRTGTGLLTCHVPECGYDIMQSGIPEAMCETDAQPAFISSVSELRRFNAAGIGPGIGQHEAAETAVANFLRAVNYPVVIDADALNLLSRHPEWYELIPKGSILTPHPKEFGRLFGKSSSGYEQWEKLRRWSAEHQLLIILKGGRTVVADYTKPYLTFNTSGNPGMATGGSGDVLTGVITGLLAQGYEPGDAARFGVYLHGLAGDLAAAENSQESMLAGDIVRHLGKAYLFLGES